MKNLQITTLLKECTIDELPESDRELIEAAKNASLKAYAPFSGFQVGAAILMDNGRIEIGSNQENAAFPSGMCAERTAAYHASAAHPCVAMKKIAIAAGKHADSPHDDPEAGFQNHPISPCGACRQALIEYEHLFGPIEVILYGKEKTYVFPSVASLLPYSFTDF